MDAVLFDSDALLMLYKEIYNPSLKIRLVFNKYLLALNILESIIDSMDVNYSCNIKMDGYINYFIGQKLINDLSKAVADNNKELVKKSIKLIGKEANRIITYTRGINETAFNCCKITRQQAKDIMLEYMSEDEINGDILEIYPETMEDVLVRNQVITCLVDKSKDGSIVKRKINLITKTVERKF